MKKFFSWFTGPANLFFSATFLAGLVFLATNSLKLWSFTIDDSYITFRYAANLAQGIGPTFNPIPPRAEGYTSFLWMLVMAVPIWARMSVLGFAKLAGILATAGSLLLMAYFIGRAGRPEKRSFRMASAGLMTLFFGLLPETSVHAVSGMETAGYTFLLTGAALLTYLAIQGERWAQDWLPLAALLAGLMRPEANLLAILMIAQVFLAAAGRRRFGLRVFFLYVLPGLLYFIWRWNYFGLLMPLPFYIKTVGFKLAGWPDVAAFCVFLLANLGLYLGAGVLGESRAVRAIALVVIPDLGFFLFSDPIMNYDYRFFYPLMPLLLALAGMGLALLMEWITLPAQANPRRWIIPAGMGCLALIMFAFNNLPRTGGVLARDLDYAGAMQRNQIAIGHAINRVAHGTTMPVVVVSDAGAIPYYSGWVAVDAGGLNDPNIALQRVQTAAYVLSFRPEVVVLTSTSLQDYQNDSQTMVNIYQQALRQGLEVVAHSQFYRDSTISIWVLARPGGEAYALLQEQFGAKNP